MKIDDNIYIKPLNINDASNYYDLTCIDREELKEIFNSITASSTLEDEINFINQLNSTLENFYIFYNDSLCGKIGVYRYNEDDLSYEIYYYLGKNYRGKDIITKVVPFFLEYIFNNFNCNKVKFYINTDNIASNKVAEKLNLIYVDTLKNHDYCNNKYHDQFVYEIKKNSFK